jgi:hypothetical protein
MNIWIQTSTQSNYLIYKLTYHNPQTPNSYQDHFQVSTYKATQPVTKSHLRMSPSRLAQRSRGGAPFECRPVHGLFWLNFFVVFFSLSLIMGERVLFNALFIHHLFIQRRSISILITSLNNQPEILADVQIYTREHLQEGSKLRASERWSCYRTHFRIESWSLDYMSESSWGSETAQNWVKASASVQTQLAILGGQCWLYWLWQSHCPWVKNETMLYYVCYLVQRTQNNTWYAQSRKQNTNEI